MSRSKSPLALEEGATNPEFTIPQSGGRISSGVHRLHFLAIAVSRGSSGSSPFLTSPRPLSCHHVFSDSDLPSPSHKDPCVFTGPTWQPRMTPNSRSFS